MINRFYFLIFVVLSIISTVMFWGDNFYSYHFILFIFLIFIIINYYLPKKIQIIILNTFLVLIVVFYCFEIYLVKNKNKKFNYYTNLVKVDGDVKVVIPIESFFSEFEDKILPLSGISNSKTLHCNENGYYSIYTSDRFGFNNFDSNYDEDVIDYILLGDSFVHGACVNFKNTFSSHLQKNLDKIVINFGFDGNGALTSYAAIREFYPKDTLVKNVVYFFSEANDLKDIEKENRDATLNKYYRNDKFTNNLVNNIEKYNFEINDVMKKKIKEFSRHTNVYFNFFTLKNIRDLIMPYFYIQNILFDEKVIDKNDKFENFNKVMSIILKIKAFSEMKNSNFIIVYLPSWEFYKSRNKDIKKNYDLLIEFFDENKINYIDITNLFNNLEKPLDFFSNKNKNSHYNEEGYKLISNYISGQLLLMN